ncbi:hypothetical protein ANTHOS_147 [Bacillus phage Anthos]|uniref:Uncharacterized protein n=6 Tax=Caudoviricetes TaxID=2731619 RepID=A0A7U3T974_9CAUD|nr:hypothetical protein AVV02_gp151 [Bacillus phage AvesoBmore]YP_009290027.1 hypothetical protein BI003_gp148 [Bacillus phage Phrodo]QDH49846.1 hypothetical protein BEYONPHE_159 [Bacillus phage Beyonphe]QPY77383.1 hypothetical protein ANTHOS_147 [Bacillus phage Anthos]ALA13537.1 hypothetical protein AVESOBMORE_151 [Bacillus phage AvesoBmore]AMW62189.1 hypothetical protein PHRODO_148 [Bacillus phage Phrodo]
MTLLFFDGILYLQATTKGDESMTTEEILESIRGTEVTIDLVFFTGISTGDLVAHTVPHTFVIGEEKEMRE